MQSLQKDLRRGFGFTHARQPVFLTLPRGQNRLNKFELTDLIDDFVWFIAQTGVATELREAFPPLVTTRQGRNQEGRSSLHGDFRDSSKDVKTEKRVDGHPTGKTGPPESPTVEVGLALKCTASPHVILQGSCEDSSTVPSTSQDCL